MQRFQISYAQQTAIKNQIRLQRGNLRQKHENIYGGLIVNTNSSKKIFQNDVRFRQSKEFQKQIPHLMKLYANIQKKKNYSRSIFNNQNNQNEYRQKNLFNYKNISTLQISYDPQAIQKQCRQKYKIKQLKKLIEMEKKKLQTPKLKQQNLFSLHTKRNKKQFNRQFFLQRSRSQKSINIKQTKGSNKQKRKLLKNFSLYGKRNIIYNAQ